MHVEIKKPNTFTLLVARRIYGLSVGYSPLADKSPRRPDRCFTVSFVHGISRVELSTWGDHSWVGRDRNVRQIMTSQITGRAKLRYRPKPFARSEVQCQR